MAEIDSFLRRGEHHLERGEAPEALRLYARAITARMRELCYISPAHGDNNNRGSRFQPPIQEAVEAGAQVANKVVASAGGNRAHIVPTPTGQAAAIDNAVEDVFVSYEKSLNKLTESRRRWMISVRKHCWRPENIDDDSFISTKYSRQQQHDLATHTQYRGRQSRRDIDAEQGKRDSSIISSAGAGVGADDREEAQLNDQNVILQAADFCPRCAAIVAVEFEYTAEGVFVAERARDQCSVCYMDKPNMSLVDGDRAHVPGKRAALFRAYGTFGSRDRFRKNRAQRYRAEQPGVRERADRFRISFRRGSEPAWNALFRSPFIGEHSPRQMLNRSTARRGSAPATTMSQDAEKLLNRRWDRDSIREDRRQRAHRGAGIASMNASLGASLTRVDAALEEEIKTRDEQIRILKQQLLALGEQPVEEIVTLQEAKERLREAMNALMAGDDSAEMEQTLGKWDKYVTNHPDHIEEQLEEERKWERNHAGRNAEALHLMRTFVPPNIFHSDLEGLRARGLSPVLAKRIFGRKVLWLLRAPEGMVSRTHVVELKSKFVANDLDLVESRALHAYLPFKFENDAGGAKAAWRSGFRERLKELTRRETTENLKASESRHAAYKDLTEGPFDPEAAVLEQETTRSSAFDAVERPVVSAMAAAKINVISEGLSKKLAKTVLTPHGTTLPAAASGDEQDGGSEGVVRPAPPSPSDKFRRQSYARSRGAVTSISMKNMMSELSSRLARGKTGESPSLPRSSSADAAAMNRDRCSSDQTDSEETMTSGGNGRSSNAVDAGVVLTEPSAEKDAVLSGNSPGEKGRKAVSKKAASPRIGAAASAGGSISMQNVMSELAVKARAREARSQGIPYAEQSNQREEQDLSGGSSTTPKVTPVVEMSTSQASPLVDDVDIPPPVLPPPNIPEPFAGQPPCAQKKTTNRTGISQQTPGVSMKDMMAELTARAKAREDRSTIASPLPPPPPCMSPATKPDRQLEKDTKGKRPATGGVSGGGMKGLMAELAAKAKDRESRSAADSR